MQKDNQGSPRVSETLRSLMRGRAFRVTAGALLLAPVVVIAGYTESVPYPTFTAGTVIKASEVNANFAYLDGLIASIDSSLGALESAIFVDAKNNVGINNDKPAGSLDVKGNLATPLTGTVGATKGSATVIGVGTKFTTELAAGNAIKVGNEVFTVSAITNDTQLTLDSAHVAGATGVTAYTDDNLLTVRNGDGVSTVVATKSGNLAIGTTIANARLYVNGTMAGGGANLDPNSPEGKKVDDFSSTGLLNGYWGTVIGMNRSAGGRETDFINYGGAGAGGKEGGFRFYVADTSTTVPMLTILANGNVGIGTTGPAATLEVNGYLLAKGIFPDFTNGISQTINTSYQATSNGFLSVVAGGSFMNSLDILVGADSSVKTLIWRMGDDLNSYTKVGSALLPMKKGTWYKVQSPSEAWLPQAPYESVTVTFFPAN